MEMLIPLTFATTIEMLIPLTPVKTKAVNQKLFYLLVAT